MMRWLLLLLAPLLGQEWLPEFRPSQAIERISFSGRGQEWLPEFRPSQAIERISFSGRGVPRLRYAIELRDELHRRGRLCDHQEDWDKTIRAIAEGAQLVEMAVCHHDKKSRRTMYRVTARWLQEKEYPSASVLEGVDHR